MAPQSQDESLTGLTEISGESSVAVTREAVDAVHTAADHTVCCRTLVDVFRNERGVT